MRHDHPDAVEIRHCVVGKDDMTMRGATLPSPVHVVRCFGGTAGSVIAQNDSSARGGGGVELSRQRRPPLTFGILQVEGTPEGDAPKKRTQDVAHDVTVAVVHRKRLEQVARQKVKRLWGCGWCVGVW